MSDPILKCQKNVRKMSGPIFKCQKNVFGVASEGFQQKCQKSVQKMSLKRAGTFLRLFYDIFYLFNVLWISFISRYHFQWNMMAQSSGKSVFGIHGGILNRGRVYKLFINE